MQDRRKNDIKRCKGTQTQQKKNKKEGPSELGTKSISTLYVILDNSLWTCILLPCCVFSASTTLPWPFFSLFLVFLCVRMDLLLSTSDSVITVKKNEACHVPMSFGHLSLLSPPKIKEKKSRQKVSHLFAKPKDRPTDHRQTLPRFELGPLPKCIIKRVVRNRYDAPWIVCFFANHRCVCCIVFFVLLLKIKTGGGDKRQKREERKVDHTTSHPFMQKSKKNS